MADMVAMGRPLLADPDWGTKIAAGKACDIRRCISCNKGCTDAIQNRQFLSCVLNAENGYENTRSIQPAAQKKKMAVLGGGPAGLEAARVAALRGHDVTLFEKTTSLGGQLNIACVPPRKEEMRRAAQDLIHAVCNAGVHLCMGQTRTAEQLKDAGFEAVINAVGAHSAAPRIPGIDSVNVADAWKVLAGRAAGVRHGGCHRRRHGGCETAEYLAARGCKVSVIEMMDRIAAGESTTILPTLLENYKTYGVEQYPSHKVKEFRMDAVVCENKDGAEVTIPAITSCWLWAHAPTNLTLLRWKLPVSRCIPLAMPPARLRISPTPSAPATIPPASCKTKISFYLWVRKRLWALLTRLFFPLRQSRQGFASPLRRSRASSPRESGHARKLYRVSRELYRHR